MSAGTAVDHARDLLARGLAIIPVPHASKRPTIRGWPDLRLTAAELPRRFGGAPRNVGVLLGEPSGWIVDVDIDDARALALADSILPPTGATWGRASNPRSHRLYRVTRPVDYRPWADAGGGMIVELRSTGCMTVAPGSTHPSGEAVRWDESGEPAAVDPDELVAALETLARAVKSETNCAQPSPDTCRPVGPVIPVIPADPVGPVVPVRTPEEALRWAAVTEPGQHDRMTFELARGLKLNCGLTLADARPWFDRWWAAARPHCSNQDGDSALFKFERAWGRVRMALGAPGVAAVVLARCETLPDVPEATGFGPKCALLVRALAEMHRANGGEPFTLTTRLVADALRAPVQTAQDWIRGLEARGLIKCVDRGRPGANGTGRARRVRWIGGGHGAPGARETQP